MKMMGKSISIVLTLTAILLSACDDTRTPPDNQSYPLEKEQAVESAISANTTSGTKEYPFAPLWGDTHLHTSYSFDVYLFGTPTSTPDTAYRFAKGQKVTSPTTGEEWQLSRPLDFLVVADHAELMGNVARIFAGDESVADTKTGRILAAIGGEGSQEALLKTYHFLVNLGTGGETDYEVDAKDAYMDLHGGTKRQSIWADIAESADSHNKPGTFTAFIGWEWTSQPGGANLHRVIFTPSDAGIASQYLPYSQLESSRPEDLWTWLDATSERTGAEFIAIPHNANVSMGRMFPLEDSSGNPISAEYAKSRMKWERVAEMTQIKGDSETHPLLSPVDEFADFETWNYVMIPSGPTPDPEIGDYVRSSLKRGLELEAKLGINPYKFGLIGSTDAHTGMSAVEETRFAGKGQKDSRPELRSKPTGLGSSRGWDMGAAGYVGAWAAKNTRQSIFDAFLRKEVYATTGTRINLRFFGGWNYSENDFAAESYPGSGYEKGVPMGGDLPVNVGDQAPQFMLSALKDPDGANLDRLQIVKGWIDAEGKAKEEVYDVAWSSGRERNANERIKPVGNTVDLKTGRYTNSIGAIELHAIWTDPDFKLEQAAFYYVRVLEIPTPRYSLLDTIRLGIDPAVTNRPSTIQERAYSSPIWYTP